jgi:hypothetical protein
MGKHEDLARETRAHYEKNPRCMNEDGRCVYDDLNGNNCAVGRILPQYACRELDKKGELDGGVGYNIRSAIGMAIGKHAESNPFNKRTSERLKKLGEEYNKDFLFSLQCLHDEEDYWTDGGMTEWGINTFNYLLDEAKRADKRVAEKE